MKFFSSAPGRAWKTLATRRGGGQAALYLDGERHQQVSGFGGCFNELGWKALGALNSGDRKRVLDDLFLPGKACSFNYCRMPIGSSDFGLEWYSLNETDGDYAMRHFSISRDRKIIIPYIREALRRRPGMKLFASPWSPPTWMKFPKAYNYGRLRREKKVLDAYALYFLRFVEAYRGEGITVHQVHPQNEPVADQKFPSCLWSGEELRDFIRDHLGPLLRRRSPKTEVWLGTLNTDDFDGYPLTALSDPKAAAYIKGLAFQWGGKGAIQRAKRAFPNLPLIQSENECGEGKNTWDYAQYIFRLIHHYFLNGVTAYVYWNMVLPEGGLSTWGWPQNSMITVDLEKGKAAYRPEYHLMRHFSQFVQPGAVRLGLAGIASGNALGFENPDGGRVLVLHNPFRRTWNLELEAGREKLSLPLPASSFNTVLLRA